MGADSWPGCGGSSRHPLADPSGTDNKMSFDMSKEAGSLGWRSKCLVGGATTALRVAGAFHPPRDAKFSALNIGRGTVQAEEFAEARFKLECHEFGVLGRVHDSRLALPAGGRDRTGRGQCRHSGRSAAGTRCGDSSVTAAACASPNGCRWRRECKEGVVRGERNPVPGDMESAPLEVLDHVIEPRRIVNFSKTCRNRGYALQVFNDHHLYVSKDTHRKLEIGVRVIPTQVLVSVHEKGEFRAEIFCHRPSGAD